MSTDNSLLALIDLANLSLEQVLMRLTIAPVVVAAIIGYVRFRYLPLNLRYLVALITFVLPIEVLGMVLMLLHRKNLFLMPIYTTG